MVPGNAGKPAAPARFDVACLISSSRCSEREGPGRCRRLFAETAFFSCLHFGEGIQRALSFAWLSGLASCLFPPPAGFPARGFLFSDRRCLLRDSRYPHSDTGFRLNRKHCGYWQAFLHDLVTRELGGVFALMIAGANGNASEGAEAVPCPVFGMSCPGNAGLIVAARIAGAGLDRNGASA